MLDRKHLIKPTFLRKMTSIHPSKLFGTILRELVEFKNPGLAVTVVATRACRRHLSSLVVSRVHKTLFFIRFFHLHSMFPHFSLFPWPHWLAPPPAFRFLYLFAPPLFMFPRIFPARPHRKLQLGRIWRKFRSSSLHNVEYSVGTAHIYYSLEIYNEERIAPYEKCRPNSI